MPSPAPRLISALAGTALLVGLIASPVAAGSATTFYVDDDGQVGANGCNGTAIVTSGIQAVVDLAVPGDTVRVCPGTYYDHIAITTPDLTLEAVDPGTAIIRNLVVVSAGRNAPAGLGSGALILVDGADRTTVTGLTLVAPAPALTPVGGDCRIESMIMVTNDADQVSVRENVLKAAGPASFGPCGYSNGITYETGSSGSVAGNLVWNFAGEGIAARGAGTTVRSAANELRFWHKQATAGPVGGSGGCVYGAGITYSDDATGRIVDNTIPGLATAGVSTPLICPGIYLQGAGSGILVARNRVVNAFDGINTAGTNDWVLRDNLILDSRNDGLLVPGSRRGLAEDNVVRRSGARGIVVESGGPVAAAAGYPGTGLAGAGFAKNNTFTGNTSTGNTGRDCLDPTVGTRTLGTANTWIGNASDGNDRPNGICPL